jgi:hypothetical protein
MGKAQKNTSQLVVLGVVSTLACLAMSGKAAALSTQFHLDIASKLCVVDIVQDGGTEMIQVPSAECETILPTLLTSMPEQGTATDTSITRVQLPFAGEPSPLAGRLSGVSDDQPWSPTASTESADGSVQAAAAKVSIVAGGVGAVAVMTFLCADVVLFEFNHSIRVVRWIRSLFIRA